MKIQKIAVLASLFLALSPLSYAHAENATSTKVRAAAVERKAEVKENVAAKRSELEAKRDQLKAEVKDKRMSIVGKFSGQMLRVHKAALERLKKLADRIDSRINKFETSKNVNLADAKTELVAARAKITVAENYINTLPGLVSTAATGTPKTALDTVKGYFTTSRDNLKAAHASLVDVISSLKVGAGIASSTASTTNR